MNCRLLTWNLNARRQVRRQIEAINERKPHLIALQEVTATSVSVVREEFSRQGLSVLDSFSTSPPWTRIGPRRYGVMLASRFTMSAVAPPEPPVWPERLLSARLDMPSGAVTFHTTHIPPGSSNGWIKIHVSEGVLRMINTTRGPQILCGDFNLPQSETPAGEIVTWGQRLDRNNVPHLVRSRCGKPAGPWDAAERAIMRGGEVRLVDAFRRQHGYLVEEFSWFLRRGDRRIGRRFDHVFCSPELRVTRVEYLHQLRELGLSDHSALEVDFVVSPVHESHLSGDA